MAQRKPNNLPWVILGGICGLGFLGLFGFGIYSGAKAVSDEASVTLPEFPKVDSSSQKTNALSIFVDRTGSITFDGERVEDVDALKAALESLDAEGLNSTVFILRISEKSSHSLLIAIKDLLDGYKVKSVIEVVREGDE